MTDVYHYNRHQQQQYQLSESRAHQVVKAVTAATAGGSLIVLSGLTLVGTVIALTVATPLLVIFSPVLVPAVIAVFLLAAGFFTTGGFGLAAATVLTWMYRYVTGGHPRGEGSVDQQRYKMWGSKGRDRDQHVAGKGHHATGGVQLTTGARAGLYQS